MNIRHLNIGILHSLIGKNDGVSIVIDQTVNAMVQEMNVRLGNIFFLAAHSSPRFNAQTNEIFWHKNEIHKTILKFYNEDPPVDFEEMILENAAYAKKVLTDFIVEHDIDLLIAHNTSHPYNFITAVALGMYIEEHRADGIIWPKVMVWWHDSHFERERFSNPNPVIKKYLKYLPGTAIDGIVFINSHQRELAKRYFKEYVSDEKFIENFFRYKTILIPNSNDITWDWRNRDWAGYNLVIPPQDRYNDSFFKDSGMLKKLEKIGFDLDETVILLQHTRIVPRKKIERTMDLAFMLDKKIREKGDEKCVAILISGYSGDEQTSYKENLERYYRKLKDKNPVNRVVLVFGENVILSHRDIIVDRKYYKFEEIPGVIAGHGGIGTYFSEVEGFGNNLLEMIANGLPVLINKYDTYKRDIEKLGFDLPSIEDGSITPELVDQAYQLIYDIPFRNRMVRHNLEVLERNLSHKIVAKKLAPFIREIFTRDVSVSHP